jgi:hypothetical protein
MSVRELLLSWGTLALFGALIFSSHVLHGGLYMDDWADAAGALHPPGGPGFGNSLAFFNNLLSSCRPVLILFFPLKYFLLGTHTKYLLALAVVLAILVAALLYAVLRVLNLPWYHSWLIAALTLAYPWFDGTRFWESASPVSLALVFGLAGLWVALVGLSRRSLRLHACAAFLYLLSMLTYEITLPVIAAGGVLYIFRAGWRVARLRWALDLAMVVIAGLWARTHTPRPVSSPSGAVSHLWEIVTHGGELLARTVLPLGIQPHTVPVLALLAAVFAAGLIGYRALPAMRPDDSDRWGLRDWLLLGIGGLVVASLGWLMFIPADPYYTPSVFGFTNRVNGLSGLGLILVVYSALGIVGQFAARMRPRRSPIAIATTLALGLVLSGAYIHVIERHSRLWSEAYRQELVAIGKVQTTFPRLPHGTTVFTSNYPAYLTLGVPIFAASWDLDGAIKLRYADPSLRAYPLTAEQGLECRSDGIGLADEEVESAPYGTARLLDLQTGSHTTPRNMQQCLNAAELHPPGPLYLSTTY